MNKTKIVKCGCVSEFQDKEYGVGNRATTPVNKEQIKKIFTVRCTVCGKEKNAGSIAEKE
jgi:hypothetical protein